MLVLLTVCSFVWMSEQDFFLFAWVCFCPAVVVFHFSSLTSLFYQPLLLCLSNSFHVGCSGILSVHKDNDFRVSKEEKVAWLKSPAFNCRMQIPSHSRQTAPLTPLDEDEQNNIFNWNQYKCLTSVVYVHVSEVHRIIVHMLVLRESTVAELV